MACWPVTEKRSLPTDCLATRDIIHVRKLAMLSCSYGDFGDKKTGTSSLLSSTLFSCNVALHPHPMTRFLPIHPTANTHHPSAAIQLCSLPLAYRYPRLPIPMFPSMGPLHGPGRGFRLLAGRCTRRLGALAARAAMLAGATTPQRLATMAAGASACGSLAVMAGAVAGPPAAGSSDDAAGR